MTEKVALKDAIRSRDFSAIAMRDLLSVGIPALLLIAAAFWITARFVRPAPPRRVVMTTGAEGGAYQAFAVKYRQILAREKITLELKPSSGGVENLERLVNAPSGVDIGFVQGGVASDQQRQGLSALGSLYYEPLWVFYRGREAVDRLSPLKGKRIAVGPEGSGTRKLALDLLALNGVTPASARLNDLGGTRAVTALQQGDIDAAFFIAAPEAPTVNELLTAGGIQLLSFAQAEAYTRRFPFLSKLVLAQGVIDFGRNIPAHDVTLLAPTAMLVVRDDFHPALVDLFLEAATEVHGGPGVFQRAGDFPGATSVDFPLNPDAGRIYKQGRPLLRRHLPFWVATFIERMLILLVPILVALIPVMRFAPALYDWRVKRKLFRWYGDLKALEAEIEASPNATRLSTLHNRLNEIESGVHRTRVPNSYANLYYNLRQHIDFVRTRLNHSPSAGT